MTEKIQARYFSALFPDNVDNPSQIIYNHDKTKFGFGPYDVHFL